MPIGNNPRMVEIKTKGIIKMSGSPSFFEQILMLILYALIPLAGGTAVGAIIGLFVGWLREAYLWWACWGAGVGFLIVGLLITLLGYYMNQMGWQ